MIPSLWINFNKNFIKKNFIVYVDENIFFSRDQFLFGDYKNHKKSKRCKFIFKRLVKFFFEIIENKFNNNVIISCSKKVYIFKNLFGGRKIYYGKTLKLISQSKLVVGHRGDSLYQACILKNTSLIVKIKIF